MFSVSRHSLIQWILLFILGGVLLAWQLSERSTTRHRRQTMVLSQASLRRPADTFVVLRYASSRGRREGEEGDFAGLLSEHLNMLQQEGFNTISAAEVLEFYRDGKLLPEKSVLVTFDDDGGTVFRTASQALEQRSFRGVAFITFGTRMQGDSIRLPWHTFRAAFRSGYWEMGSTGLKSTHYVSIDEEGTPGHFLSNRRWLRSENRLETEEEYNRRIRGDLREGRNILEARIKGLEVRAFAYPFSDYGQGSTNVNDAGSSIRAAVRSRHSLAFRHNGYGWNYQETDPFLLNRVTVDHSLIPRELLGRLEASAPREGSILDDFDSPRLSDGWRLESGECGCGEGRLVLSPKSGQVGGQLWLSGTEKWRNCTVAVTVETSSDEQCWVYFRHRDKGNFVRVGKAGDGLYIQQKVGGKKLHTLGEFSDDFEPNTPHRLRVCLIGHRLKLSCDEILLDTGTIEIDDSLSTGKIGLGIIGLRTGGGLTSFSAFRADETGSMLVLARNLDSADNLEQVSKLLPNTEIFSPLWFSISARTGLLTSRIENQDLVRMLASYNNLRLMPTVLCHSVGYEGGGAFGDRSTQEDVAETLIAHASKLSFDGYLFWPEGEGTLLHGETSAEETRLALPKWIRSLRERLRNEGLRFALGVRFENARQLSRELLGVSQEADVLVARLESEEGFVDSLWVGSPQTRSWTISRAHVFMVGPPDRPGDHGTPDARFAGIGKAILVGNHERTNQEKESQEKPGAFQ